MWAGQQRRSDARQLGMQRFPTQLEYGLAHGSAAADDIG
jgi:hypothetical protein